MINIHIKEKSWLARIAAWKLGAKSVAIVVGNTIYLHNATRNQFLKNKQWVRHEVAHVRQYKTLGIFYFIATYIKESCVNGYFNNRFEIEARLSESDGGILNGVRFLT